MMNEKKRQRFSEGWEEWNWTSIRPPLLILGLAMKTNTDVKMVTQKTRNPDLAVGGALFVLCFTKKNE